MNPYALKERDSNPPAWKIEYIYNTNTFDRTRPGNERALNEILTDESTHEVAAMYFSERKADPNTELKRNPTDWYTPPYLPGSYAVDLLGFPSIATAPGANLYSQPT